jgi:hypothetical protein
MTDFLDLDRFDLRAFEPLETSFSDSSNFDAFGRLRVSNLTTLIDIKQLYDKQPLLVDEAVIDTGASSHSTTTASTTMTTGASGDAVVRQTFQRCNYQSGKSHLCFFTFGNFDLSANVTKRVGYFSSSATSPFTADFDGIFLQNDGTNVSLQVYRTGTNTLSKNQSAWNDPMDSSGASGITIDWTKDQIFALDFEWLGSGRIRFYFVIDGIFYKVHEMLNANSQTEVYMSSPNQPIRYEIRQSGAGAGSFKQICASINSEGATNLIGKNWGIDDNGTKLDANSVSAWYYAIGLRLKSTHFDTIVDVLNGILLATTNDNFLVRVVLNPTYASTVTYTDVTNSAVQYGLGATANTVSAMGTVLFSGSGYQLSVSDFELDNSLRIGASLLGVADEIVVIIKPLSVNLDIHRSINWREL